MSVATAALVRFCGPAPPRYAPTENVGVGRVHLFGTEAWIAYRRDDDEWRRRGDSPPILALDVLDALMTLPAGLEVPVAAVARADQRLLRELPPGSLDWSATTVTRHVVPALMPLLAMVRSTGWLEGLRAASRFAAYCPRLVLVSAVPAEWELAQAAVYGIGVAVADDTGDPQIVVEPEQLLDRQPTPAWWWFTEEIYQQVRVNS
jgi:hypothetical protein